MTKSEISKKLYSLGIGGTKLLAVLNSIDYCVHTKSQCNIGKYEFIKDITIEYNDYFKNDCIWVHYEATDYLNGGKYMTKMNVFVL